MTTPLPRPADPTDKAAWRAAALRARAGVDRTEWSHALVNAVRAWPAYQRADTVALYLPTGSEADLTSLLSDGKRFCAPRTPARGRHMTMHELGGPLERHRFGNEQPGPDAPLVADDAIDVALVPGLAFDVGGVRIGYGGGYYDAWLPGLRPDASSLGVAHPVLLAESLPALRHDARLTHLVLPDGVRACGSKAG